MSDAQKEIGKLNAQLSKAKEELTVEKTVVTRLKKQFKDQFARLEKTIDDLKKKNTKLDEDYKVLEQ